LRLNYCLRIKSPVSNSTGEARSLLQRLARSGLRYTRQRDQIFQVVADSHDHPTAEEIFARAKKRLPEVSFATVYNCLSVLVQCGLVRQVTLEKSPARFCPNMREHCHFMCEICGGVTDIDMPAQAFALKLPHGYKISHFDVSLQGNCPKCEKSQASRAEPAIPQRR
jgi:Fe2+ or Zn2+ uptake regulation protein